MKSGKEKKTGGLYGTILAGATVWCAAILLFPLLGDSAARGIRFFFSRICHQEPHRSFSLAGTTLPVCARCTGIYLGFWAGVLFSPLFRKRIDETFPWRLAFSLVVAVNLIEALLDERLWTTPWPRTAAGSVLGGLAALCTLSGLLDLSRNGRESLLTCRERTRADGENEMKGKETVCGRQRAVANPAPRTFFQRRIAP